MRVRRLFRRSVILVVSASLLTSLTPAAAAPPGIDTSAKLPELQQEKSVPGEAVPVRPQPPGETAEKAITDIPAPEWPGKGKAEVDLPAQAQAPKAQRQQGGSAGSNEHRRAGTLPVAVGHVVAKDARQRQQSAKPESGRVQVETFDQDVSAKLGVAGALIRVAGRTPVSVRVDYGKFSRAYGADYGSRLRLVEFPECAVTTPGKPECRTGRPLKTENNQKTQQVTAEVDLTAGEQSRTAAMATSVLAVAADTDSSAGSFSATDLAPSGKWSAGGSSGDFSYSYPLTLPPSPADNAPNLSLGYSSGSLDGRTSTTNNQASVVGDGWELNGGGFIERRYKPCAEDLGGNQGQTKTGDRCWATDNATMSLGGTSTELVRDSATGEWRPKNDDGSRVERLTGAANGDNNGEYWKVTSIDGTQYFLGRNRLPGWVSGKPETRSAWTMPVFGNNSAEPCNKATFAESWCQQAWRWNLDYSVDPQGNVVTYFYGAETNYYGRNRTASAGTPYVRGGHLERIEYGLRSDNFFGTPAARAVFTTAERCLPSGTITCDPGQLNKDTAKSWPDVPFDQICAAGASCDYQHAPSFFTRKRLTKITTQVHSGTGWRNVDSWSLRQQFPDSGDGLAPALWLAGITHTGHVGGTASTPEVVFGGHSMANRVDAAEGIAPITRYRITSIRNETGGYTAVKYSDPDCRRADRMPANPETNTMRCYPTWWVPDGAPEPILDWFHKYVVTLVVDDDRTGGSALVKTAYEYLGGGAWHFDDNDFAKLEQRTWSAWRGYGKVRTTVGEPGTTQSVTEALYFRGMDEDRLPGGGKRDVWVTDSEGGRAEDHQRLIGYARETLQYNGGKVVSASVKTPWLRGPTATNGDDRAYLLDTAEARGRTLLENGSWRRTKVNRTYNAEGLLEQVDDAGDVAVSGDESCARTDYARNEGARMLNYVSRVREVALPCSAGTGTGADVVSDVRTAYDGQAHGAAPTRGLVTETERWNGSGYQVAARTSFDAYGRITERFDAAGAKTTIAYSPATGPVSKVTTTNALGHVSVNEMEPAWGSPVVEIGPNGERAEAVYDPLGRVVKAWLPGRSKSGGQTPNLEYAYSYKVDAPTVVTTKSLLDDGTYATSHTLFDGMLRERQSQIPATGGGRILTDTLYDSRGLAWKTNAGYYNADAPSTALHGVLDNAVPNQTVTEFDGLQRPTAVIYRKLGIEQWRTSSSYGGDRVHVTPPPGGTPTTVISNVHDEVVERRQYHGDTTSGDYDVTKQTYTAKRQLASLTDPAGNTWRYHYDALGRKTRDEDPDRGTTTYTYNNLDQLVSSTDARGKTLAYSYDVLGRKNAMFEGSVEGTKLAEWTFDSLKKGLPTASTRFVDGQAYTREVGWYDSQNRVTTGRIIVPEREGKLAGTYTFRTSYTVNTGLVASTTMPSAGGLPAERIYHDYNQLGMPTKTYGIDTYAQEQLYSPYGETLRLTLGDGANKAWITNYFQEGTRRLDQTILDRNTDAGYRVADRSYSYDAIGNITSIADKPKDGVADVQCFEYDYLRRLTTAFTPASTDCATEPSVATLGGAAPYWMDFGYDKVGNRTSQVLHRAEGNTTRTYEYPAPGQAQPHTLLSVTEDSPSGTARDEFGYDEVGNSVTRKVSGDTQTLEWDSEGRVSKVTHADGAVSSHVYDASGDRLIKREPGKATLYLDGMELTLNTGTDEVTGQRYYEHAGSTVAIRSSVGGVTMMMGDHQGTSTVSLDADNLAITRRYFDPFGNARGDKPESWPTERSFVGGVDDATGLTHIGAREYDSVTGRFISVDPIMDITDPQQIHGYAYSNNSPVTFSDSTGLMYGSQCGPDGILCGHGEAISDPNYTNNRVYWMRERGHPESSVQRFVNRQNADAARNVARKDAQAQALREAKISQAEYEELRRVAASKKTWWDHTKEQLPDLAADLVGITDVKECLSGEIMSCVWAIINAIPIARAGKFLSSVQRLAGAVIDGFRWADKVAASRQRLNEVSAAARRILSKPSCNSFVPGTLVLMADGSQRPIEDVELGDRVLATDAETGESAPREVVATIIGQGQKDLVEISVSPERLGVQLPGTLVATDGHPFWVPDLREWIPAGELTPGTWLQTGSGTWVQVTGVKSWIATQRVHNLTVDTDHTYNVFAGVAPVLTHNSGPNCGVPAGGKNGDRLGGEDFHGSEYSLDEMVGFVNGHTGDGNPVMGRPSAGEVESALRQAGPRQLDGQSSSRFDNNGVRVIVNWDMPWKSTAYYPGK